jgi:hypothetical protein
MALRRARPPARRSRRGSAREAGWRPLFDGRTLRGWRAWRRDELPEGWMVLDGALARVGPGGDLVSLDTFDDFELALEWRLAPGGNSGVLVRADEAAAAPAWSGLELQLVDDARHEDGRSPRRRCGALYDLYEPACAAARPAGAWNTARLLVEGPRVIAWLNGVEVVQALIGDTDWAARVAASKFARSPGFGLAPRGHVVLQDHGDPVWFRRLRLRPLR